MRFFCVCFLSVVSASMAFSSGSCLSLPLLQISLQSRRLLHQPFLPIQPSPPSQPPSPSPFTPTLQPSYSPPAPAASPSSYSSSQPKLPSTTSIIPFFPTLSSPPLPPPSPPPPSPGNFATFPANISSLVLPSSNPPAKSRTQRIALGVLLPAAALALVSLLIAFFLYGRRHCRRSSIKGGAPDGHRLVSDDLPSSSDAQKAGASGEVGSESLYLGTSVSSRGVGRGEGDPGNVAKDSPYQKLGSPELHPLPPLARQLCRSFSRNVSEGARKRGREGAEDEEEFFSPRVSLGGEKESSCPAPFRVDEIPGAAKLRSKSLNLRTPSYPSSSSESSIHSQGSSSESTCRSHSASLRAKGPKMMPTSSNSPSPFSSFRSEIPQYEMQNSASASHSSGSKSPSPPHIVIGRPNPASPTLGKMGIAGQNVNGPTDSAVYPPPRPRTPSPSKRKPPSLSPPCSPEGVSDENPVLFEGNPLVSGDHRGLLNHSFGNPSHPPRPPPLPPPGFWDNPFASLPIHGKNYRPPVDVSTERNPMVVAPDKQFESSDLKVAPRSDHNRPKLKPLHWDKVQANSDRVMVWDQLKSSSFQLNEEMIQTLFMCHPTNSLPKEATRRAVFSRSNHESIVLDPKKSHNIAILLKALSVTIEEVCEAILDGNADGLSTELLETLLRMAPTREEEIKLKEYKDDSVKLGPAERFLKSVIDIPFAFKRVDAMLYIANFDSEVEYLKNSFETLEAACEELRSSRMFLKLLEAVLKTGNRMNVGTSRGDAHAFKLDTLLKLADVKGADGKTTLLHFVVQEIIRYEGSRLSESNPFLSITKTEKHSFQEDVECRKLGLQVVSGLSSELLSVKKVAAMESEALSNNVSKLAAGIGKIAEVVRLNESASLKERNQRFSLAMNDFLKKAESEIIKIQGLEGRALSLVREITEYFHGNSAKEEAHPFRIFMVVRDFLSILDNVCKEVGKINERTIMSSAQQLQSTSNLSQPSIFPHLHGHHADDSDDDNISISP